MLKRILFLLIIVTLLLSACGGAQTSSTAGQSAASGGNAETGKKLFSQSVIPSAGGAGCASCHSVEKDKMLVGPSMFGVAGRAETVIKSADYRGAAKTSEEYLRESIVNPDAFVAKGYSAGVMLKNYAKLSDQEVKDLVAYLLTVK